ncbi:MAG TPA: bifunctional UDP-3-O-[3-hydroxymyristoyl] N-acetylglucosamine deacetylase/3-hydroxyacyl-ACP dehydratase [Chthoniobacterales bacterium]|jgi:UDP-3-O-[3-hydroxymyristoyl] N-acetylglucosamine deacetylase/3-hydroxyacyl-[acyl-carrier-protein] dehydratase|nr:bifunctional UDP-3-O-[3-hydroxymyristoyl] N-acetylglucosamine deacetylase/3-hydroxyacyl-ACP dehydratase [Chthoniobacterales bacterium]
MPFSYQQTLATSASLTGTSLHTGSKVSLRLSPAPVDHGIKFKRIDLPDEPTIDAKIHLVKFVERATTIAEGNVKVHTVEHVLSALCGMGVDNALVQMDSSEAPIGDGSAYPFVELINTCGIEKQTALRRTMEIREPLHVETKTGSLLTVVPDRTFRISCTQVGPEGRFTQYYSTEITPEIYQSEIAKARTFVFYEDLKPLLEKGLIRGGSLENAIVVRGESVMGKEPLRYQDEFVRHKILDIVGDLFLAGCRFLGHVIAVKPGHAANAELTKLLAKRYATLQAMAPPQVIPRGTGVMDSKDIMAVLPHRYPFLMVDRILSFEGDNKIVGAKQISINEPYFQGHFPGHPVMPGVLQVEAMAQVASILLRKQSEQTDGIGYFMSADGVKFRKPVTPGDMLVIEAELLRAKSTIGKASCRCLVNGEVASEGILTFAFVLQ